MDRLKKRAGFLRAARGEKWVGPSFVLQARRRADGDQGSGRVGYTASRKVGNAVKRNRARRRLKEAVRMTLAQTGQAGTDYVVVARGPALDQPFARMVEDLSQAVERVHTKLARRLQSGAQRAAHDRAAFAPGKSRQT